MGYAEISRARSFQSVKEDNMNIAYLSNIYPVTSATFIRREIRALEKMGVDITRFAIRQWTDKLVDPADIEEQAATQYLLTGNSKGVITDTLKCLKDNPGNFWRALKTVFTLIKNAKGSVIYHFAYLGEACCLYRAAGAKNIEHIHAHYSTNTAAVALLCQELGGPSYSFTVHGPDELDAPQHNSTALKIAKAAFVVAITDFCKSQLIRYSNFDNWNKIYVFRCGIATDEFSPSGHTFSDNMQLVCVARMSGLKGQMLFPDAIAPIVGKHPNVKIVIVGDGEMRPKLEAKIKALGLEKHFDLRGWQTNQQVNDIVGQSRALILPSFAEGLPIVFMEAFALARPVLATYIAGIPELIDESCGWVVPAGSIERLTTALDELLSASPEQLEAMGKEGRRRVEAMHDINGLAANLKQAFEQHLQR